MKTNVWLILIAFLIIIFACKDDVDDVDYEFIGNWEAIRGVESKTTLNLSKDECSLLFLEMKNNEWFINEGYKFSIAVSGNELTLTLSQFCEWIYNDVTQTYENGIWYGSGTEEFNYIIDFLGGDTFKAEFSVSDNELTFAVDENRDGIYSTEETAVFIKV